MFDYTTNNVYSLRRFNRHRRPSSGTECSVVTARYHTVVCALNHVYIPIVIFITCFHDMFKLYLFTPLYTFVFLINVNVDSLINQSINLIQFRQLMSNPNLLL